MIKEIYLNNGFKSGSANFPFARIMFALENGTMFGAMSKSEDLVATKFSFENYDYKRHVRGVNPESDVLTEEIFFNNLDCLPVCYDEKVIASLKASVKLLSRAFRYHCTRNASKGITYSIEDQNEIYKRIAELKRKFEEWKSVPKKEGISEPIYEEFTSDDSDKVNKVVEEVFKAEGEIVEVDGEYFTLKIENEVPKIFKVRNLGISKSHTITPVEVKSKPKKTYKTKKMAYCVNDTNLYNFNKHELYEIIKKAGEYLLLKDIFGNECHVKSGRFEEIDVYEDVEALEVM